jgi:predicted oxidoreductase (fatty acid repression mutant protein)
MPAVSKAQQRFMGMVHAADKGETPASPEVAKVSADMKDSDAKDFASTKHDGLPDHVKEQLKSVVREVIREKNGMNEMSSNDVHFKHIMKMYDRGGSFTKKKIGAVVCKDPNASRKDIEEELFDADYKDIIEFEDELGLKEIREKYNSVNEEFKHVIHVDTPTQVVSKPIAAQIMALAKKGVRANEIGLEMGFVGNQKLATDAFQKVKNKIYFELDKRNESINEDIKSDVNKFLDKLNKEFPDQEYTTDFKGGKYARITHQSRKFGQPSAWGFIAMDDNPSKGFKKGDLLKAAGFNTPAKHARGNILNGDAKYDKYSPTYLKEELNEGAHGMATKILQSVVNGDSSRAEGTKMSKELAQHYIDWIRTSPFGKKNSNLPLDMLVKASFNWGIERGLDSKLKGELSKLKSTIKESVNEVKYPTDLKVGSVILGQGFTMLKGIEGGKYYKVVSMDDTTATLTPSDKNGNTKGSSKVRHKLDSIEGGIKTAKRGDENGIVVIKESVNEEHDCGCNENHDCGCGGLHEHHINEDINADANGIAGLTASRANAVKDFIENNNINSNKLYLFLKKGNLKDRMDFVTALVGKPGNPIQKKVIKQFSN